MALSCFLSRLCSAQSSLRVQPFTHQILKWNLVASTSHRISYDGHQVSTSAIQNELRNPDKNRLMLINQFSTSSQRFADHKGHSHVTIWRLERLLSAIMLPLIPAALLNPCQALDTLVAVIIVMHNHWGLEAIIVDYVRPILFGALAPKIGIALLYTFSAVVLAGLLNLIYNDCGLANAFLEIWKL